MKMQGRLLPVLIDYHIYPRIEHTRVQAAHFGEVAKRYRAPVFLLTPSFTIV